MRTSAIGMQRGELDAPDAGQYLIEVRTSTGRVVKRVTVL